MKTANKASVVNVLTTMYLNHRRVDNAWEFIESEPYSEILEVKEYYFKQLGTPVNREIRLWKNTNRISVVTQPNRITKF